MFLLVTVFLHAGRRRSLPATPAQHSGEIEKFIARKKAIALALTVLLVSLAAHVLYGGVHGHDLHRCIDRDFVAGGFRSV